MAETFADVCEIVNADFTNDINSLQRSHTVHDQLLEKITSLRNQLLLASNEAPTQIEQAFREGVEMEKTVVGLGTEESTLKTEVMGCLQKSESSLERLRNLIDKIDHLEKQKVYLKHVLFIDSLTVDIKDNMIIDGKATTYTESEFYWI